MFNLENYGIDLKVDVNKITQLGNECSNIKYYDEPYTCKNDELRKLYYFYNNQGPHHGYRTLIKRYLLEVLFLILHHI